MCQVFVDTSTEVDCCRAILSIVVEEQGKLCAAVDADFVVIAEDDIAVIVVELEGAEAQYFVVGEAGILLDIDVVIPRAPVRA